MNAEIEADADRHTITTDVSEYLDTDPDFGYETTKPLPENVHPNYTDTDAELWQKPASKVECMDGSQGFLQVWIPVDEAAVTLVSATAGEYDRETVVDAVRKEIEAATA